MLSYGHNYVTSEHVHTHHECRDISSLLPTSTMTIECAHGGHTAPAQGGPSTANTHPRGRHNNY